MSRLWKPTEAAAIGRRLLGLAILCGGLAMLPASCLAQSGSDAASAGKPGAATASTAAGEPIHAAAAAVVQRYPAQSIDSVAAADAALADIRRARADIETRHRTAQLACRPAFFMTRCLDAAQEKRRAALALLRPVEVEANAFKRHERVVERDRALAEKNAKADRDAEQNAAKVRKPAPAPAAPAPLDTAAPGRDARGAGPATPHPRTPHVAKPLTPKIDAATEARNIADYDRKAAESAQRQRDVAAKKAEKEQDRARKKAEAQAAAAAPAGAATPTGR